MCIRDSVGGVEGPPEADAEEELEQGDGERDPARRLDRKEQHEGHPDPVSYTHLTLPTSDLV